MFSNILLKSIKVGEKVFHVLAEFSINIEDYEKLGLQIIKESAEMRQKMEETQKEASKQETIAPAEAGVEAPVV
jgi:hypothetical protein